MKVKIMRGPPGAGKSTYVKSKFYGAMVCSADDYFMVDGKYQYDPDKLGAAHAECLRRFVGLVTGRYFNDITVVVDNTNLSAVDVAAYYRVAEAFNCDVEIVNLKTRFENVHGVPAKKVAEMTKRADDAIRFFPKNWRVVDVG